MEWAPYIRAQVEEIERMAEESERTPHLDVIKRLVATVYARDTEIETLKTDIKSLQLPYLSVTVVKKIEAIKARALAHIRQAEQHLRDAGNSLDKES